MIKVLIINENNRHVKHIRRYLTSYEMIRDYFSIKDVFEASDSQVAKKILKDQMIDLAICHWKISGLEAFDFVKQIRSNGFNNLIMLLTIESNEFDSIKNKNQLVKDFYQAGINYYYIGSLDGGGGFGEKISDIIYRSFK